MERIDGVQSGSLPQSEWEGEEEMNELLEPIQRFIDTLTDGNTKNAALEMLHEVEEILEGNDLQDRANGALEEYLSGE